jgi:hypothetical protein
MPFGPKRDPAGSVVEFDDVYRQIIQPAVAASGMQCVRADEERVGGIIHKPMYERLLVCDYAVADLTTANANVFYESGVRHAARPWSTVLTNAVGFLLPFDVRPLRGIRYSLDSAGVPNDADRDRLQVEAALNFAKYNAVDSPLFQLIDGLVPPRLGQLDVDGFRRRVAESEVYRYLTRATPYDSTDRAQALQARFEEVQGRLSEQFRTDAQALQPDNKAVPSIATFAHYVHDRARTESKWHRIKIAEHVRQAKALRMWQLLATGLGVVLLTTAALLPAWHLTTWTTAAATIAAALGAHIAATGHQRIAESYAGTADQLDRLIAGIDPENSTAAQQARFVADVERVLAVQNRGWTDLLGNPDP